MQIEFVKLLKKFPKSRPPLTEAQQSIFAKEYSMNRNGENLINNLSQKMESWMHRQVAKNTKGKNLLELGAGNLNHLKYQAIVEFGIYDVVEPMEFLYQNYKSKHKINCFYKDIKECSQKYETIFSIAVLEHIIDLPDVIKKSISSLAQGGSFVNAIPTEGGLLWGISWRITVGLSYFLRTGMSYKNIMKHEHVNNFDEIILLLKNFFNDVTIKYNFFPNKHLSLYACVVAKNPKI